MIRLIKKAWKHLSGEAWAERVINEHQKAFPGRCPICSFHRYGLQNGLTKDHKPNPHWCPEGNSESDEIEDET